MERDKEERGRREGQRDGSGGGERGRDGER